MLQHSIPLASPHDIVDTAGTGGDGLGTFNISTAASLVIASTGVFVAKHGGRSSSSQSGSADVYEHLGLPLHQSSNAVLCSLNKHHYAYLCAPLFNSKLQCFSSLRKNLGLPTLFNLLGPLLNPMRPTRQVIGVARKELLSTMIEVLKSTGSTHAMAVHSRERMDEISISDRTFITELKQGQIREYSITPEELGLPSAPLQDVLGGTPLQNAEIITNIFSLKEQGAKRNIVLLNSAAGLVVAGKAFTLREGVEMAKQAIDSGQTLHLLQQLQGDAS